MRFVVFGLVAAVIIIVRVRIFRTRRNRRAVGDPSPDLSPGDSRVSRRGPRPPLAGVVAPDGGPWTLRLATLGSSPCERSKNAFGAASSGLAPS